MDELKLKLPDDFKKRMQHSKRECLIRGEIAEGIARGLKKENETRKDRYPSYVLEPKILREEGIDPDISLEDLDFITTEAKLEIKRYEDSGRLIHVNSYLDFDPEISVHADRDEDYGWRDASEVTAFNGYIHTELTLIKENAAIFSAASLMSFDITDYFIAAMNIQDANVARLIRSSFSSGSFTHGFKYVYKYITGEIDEDYLEEMLFKYYHDALKRYKKQAATEVQMVPRQDKDMREFQDRLINKILEIDYHVKMKYLRVMKQLKLQKELDEDLNLEIGVETHRITTPDISNTMSSEDLIECIKEHEENVQKFIKDHTVVDKKQYTLNGEESDTITIVTTVKYIPEREIFIEMHARSELTKWLWQESNESVINLASIDSRLLPIQTNISWVDYFDRIQPLIEEFIKKSGQE